MGHRYGHSVLTKQTWLGEGREGSVVTLCTKHLPPLLSVIWTGVGEAWSVLPCNVIGRLSCLTENSVFTGVDFKDIEYEHLAEAIREVCKEQNLAAIDGQVRRDTL